MSESEASATVLLTMEPKELSPDGIDITPSQDGGVLKTIKTAGTGEAGPGNGDKVGGILWQFKTISLNQFFSSHDYNLYKWQV